MTYVLGVLIAIILALGGVTKCQHGTIVTLEAQIEANKEIARRMLANEIAQGKADATASQKDYDDALKTLSDRNRVYAGKLRDPGRRDSCPAPTGTSPSVPADSSSGSELSDSAGAFLRSEADRADVAATYAAECRKHALKPTVRSKVDALRSPP